jgi:hypothetical protein
VLANVRASVKQVNWLVFVATGVCLFAINLSAFFIVQREASTTRYIEENRAKIEATGKTSKDKLCKLTEHFAAYYRLQVADPPKGQSTAQFVASIELLGYLEDLIIESGCPAETKSSSRFGSPRTTP